MPPLSEADTRAELIDPVLRLKGWIPPFIKREESDRAVDIINDQPLRRGFGARLSCMSSCI